MEKPLTTLWYLTKVIALFLLAGLFSCSRLEEQEGPSLPGNNGTEQPKADAKVFIGYTPSAEDATKTGLDAKAKMFWQTGDRIAIFRSSTNEKYLFNGEDGDVFSEFVKDDATLPGAAYTTNYALYPWAEEVASATEGTITLNLPATQNYVVKSFAQDTNLMVAVTSSSASNELRFQNLCGFVQLRFYGDATVRRVRFFGNNNEVLCGTATITAAYGSEPGLAMDGDGKVITLDCGEGGITLGATAETYTPIWLVIPPTEFTKGFTFEIERNTGVVSTKSTTKSVSITRNHALPISAIEVEQAPKELLSFALSDGVHSYSAFEIKDDIISVQVPNGIDMSSLVASFTYVGEEVSVGGIPQASGIDSHDFSDFLTPVEYVVTATDASTRTYTVRMFNLPVVTIDTPNKRPIVDKVNWIEGTNITIRETALDGTVTLTEYVEAQVRGRGNATWGFEKKPYAIKLNKKAEVLGMPKHKRWVLMTHIRGFYYSNPIGYEMSRRTESMEWAPSGRYVDLILNGTHKGCYFLAEQIKIDKNRVNITEMGMSDISGEALTGGYLLTYDVTYDERYKFKSMYYDLPVMFKDPDPDPDDPEEGPLPDEQFNYLQDYINNLEASLKDPARLAAHEYAEYIDVDTYIDQYLVWELAGRWGWKYTPSHTSEFTLPRSVWFHKDRGGKLKAGPVWDFDVYFMYYEEKFFCNKAQYYQELLSDPAFVARLKEKWPRFKARLDADGGMTAYLDSLYATARASALRDREMWAAIWRPTDPTPDEGYSEMRSYLENKIAWMDSAISALVVNYDNKGAGTEDFGAQDNQTGNYGFGF